jgi:hypothetical protein
MVVLAWVATGTGCATTQRPERRIYVIFDEAPGIGGFR